MDYNLTPIEANYRVVRKAGIWITEMLWVFVSRNKLNTALSYGFIQKSTAGHRYIKRTNGAKHR